MKPDLRFAVAIVPPDGTGITRGTSLGETTGSSFRRGEKSPAGSYGKRC